MRSWTIFEKVSHCLQSSLCRIDQIVCDFETTFHWYVPFHDRLRLHSRLLAWFIADVHLRNVDLTIVMRKIEAASYKYAGP
jgi:hypothetical protein